MSSKLNKTWTWEYDGAGNILSKSEYAYTTGTLGTATSTKSYTYGDSQWGDLLTNYNGTAITYDEVGNMLTYGSKTFTWEHGRELSSLSTDSYSTWNYAYNQDGIRTERYSNYGMEYTYYYSGSQLMRMVIWYGETYYVFVFNYDADGTLLSADYEMEICTEDWYWDDEAEDYIEDNYYEFYMGTYYYVTNAQGDVIALTDEAGNLMVEYTYDAWGKTRSTRYYGNYSIYQYDPFRYRGYVYDQETGLYYLQSRYYDPELGRFINADAAIGQIGNVQGTNMFAYCFNNPVNMSDPTGGTRGRFSCLLRQGDKGTVLSSPPATTVDTALRPN